MCRQAGERCGVGELSECKPDGGAFIQSVFMGNNQEGIHCHGGGPYVGWCQSSYKGHLISLSSATVEVVCTKFLSFWITISRTIEGVSFQMLATVF